ncbi:MAG: glycosyltransferase [Mucilaginibacter sp.]
MKEGVSIILCCYNSARRIEQTLTHLAALDTDGIDCEVVLVDNGSTDGTREAALAIWAGLNNDDVKLRIAYEPQSGLSFARQKGVDTAEYQYLIFCDDDNWLDNNYVRTTVSLFRSNPGVAALGGFGVPVFENSNNKPVWFDKLYHGYAVGGQGENEQFTNSVYGAGMAVKKDVLKQVIDHYPMLLHGRKKNTLSSGEDSEICLRIRLLGYKIRYSPNLKFSHFLPDERLTWSYLKKLHVGLAKTFVIIDLYNQALTNNTLSLPSFYWLKKNLYYWGIYLKYWAKQYLKYRNNEGTVEELNHITWKNIALDYTRYNFKTITVYKAIISLKKRS